MKEALELACEVERVSSEPLLQGIARSSQGEYYARQGNWRQARLLLESARKRFPKRDRTPDFGVTLKWWGYTRIQQGEVREGLRALSLARAILHRGKLKPEACLDVDRLALLTGMKLGLTSPELLRYPGLPRGFRRVIPGFGGALPFEGAGAKTEIDLATDEYRMGDRWYLGVPLELKAAAIVALSGQWGLPAVKLKSLLWPEQAHAFLQLEKRMHEVLRRLRREYGFDLRVQEGNVRFTPGELRSLAVSAFDPGEKIRRPRFLESRLSFIRADLELHYSLRSAQACVRIAEWRVYGWVSVEGRGPKTRYGISKLAGAGF